VTNPSGEIDVLDPAGYGAVTINHAISIQGHGFAGVSTSPGDIGITINAGTSDAVNLSGLLMEGEGTGNTGIQFNTGQALTIDQCVIRHFSTFGIDFFPSGSANLLVSNTRVSDGDAWGVFILPTGSGTIVTAAFNRVEVSNNRNAGITIDGTGASAGTIDATVSESVAAGM
jgi:hypothetical protein